MLVLRAFLALAFSGGAGAGWSIHLYRAGNGQLTPTLVPPANWSGCNSAAPVVTDDDTLIFPADSMSSSVNPSNDLTNATFNEVEFSGTGVNSVTVVGNAFTILGGISDTNSPGVDFIENPITFSGNQAITTAALAAVELDGQITDSSILTITGGGDVGLAGSNTTITGAITVKHGELIRYEPEFYWHE